MHDLGQCGYWKRGMEIVLVEGRIGWGIVFHGIRYKIEVHKKYEETEISTSLINYL